MPKGCCVGVFIKTKFAVRVIKNKFRALAHLDGLPLALIIYTKKILRNTEENLGNRVL